MRPSLPCFSLIVILAAACGDTVGDSVAEASGEGSGEGSAAGSDEGSATCWIETGAGFCPAPPTALPAAACPGSTIGDAAFATGTSLCAPAMANWSCPEGWNAVPRFAEGSGEALPAAMAALQACEPPPDPPANCPAGTIALPGRPDCEPMGIACPPAGALWHDEETLRALAPGFSGPVVYLSPDAAADGLGTRENPRLLSAAAVRAAQNGILALSVGTHHAAIRLDRHVALLGSCVEATTLTTDQPSETLGLVDISPNDAVRLSNLTITGPRPGIWVRGEVAAPHDIEAVTISETPVYGLLAESPQVINLRNVRIRDTQARASTQTLGRGLELQAGARVIATGLSLERVREVGAVVSGAGSTLEVTQLLVEATLPRASDGAFGRGIVVNAGATAGLRNAIVRDNRDVGISVSGAGAALEAEQLLVLRTAANSRGILGRGLELKGGATATLTDVVVRESHEAGIIATDQGSSLDATRVGVQDTRSPPAGLDAGVGILCQSGAAMRLEAVAVDSSRKVGVEVIGTGSQLTATGLSVAYTKASTIPLETGGGLLVRDRGRLIAEDLLLLSNADVGIVVADPGATAQLQRAQILATRSRSNDGRFGHGLQVENGGTVTANDLDLRSNREVAIDVSGAASTLRMDRLLVQDTRMREPDGRAGRAFEFSNGANVEVNDAILRGNGELAVFASDQGTRFAASRLLVAATAPQRSGILGHGLSLQEGVTASLTDIVVADNHGAGLIVTGAGTTVDLHRAAITDTSPHEADGRFGIGLGIYNQATLTGDDIALLRNKRCALQLAGPAVSLALRRVRLSGSEVGTNLQAEGFGLEALRLALQDEEYEDNGEDVAISAVEVPEPTTQLGDPSAP